MTGKAKGRAMELIILIMNNESTPKSTILVKIEAERI